MYVGMGHMSPLYFLEIFKYYYKANKKYLLFNVNLKWYKNKNKRLFIL